MQSTAAKLDAMAVIAVVLTVTDAVIGSALTDRFGVPVETSIILADK